MKPMSPSVAFALRLVLTLCIPLALVLTNVRLLMTHTFPEVEYRFSNFPADLYGFTQAQRLYWSKRSVDYILSIPGAGQIEAWKFVEDGLSLPDTQAPIESCQYYLAPRDCTYFYNDREVKHMVDVQILVGRVLWVWGIAAVLGLASAGALDYFRARAALRAGLLAGTSLTVFVLVALVTYLLLNFNTFFTQFHQVFFTGDTWLFLWSDSLIRLFPEKFWEDAFIFVGGGAIVEAALIAAWAWWGLK
jgi:integral membrane protein (TIGR01906 family)